VIQGGSLEDGGIDYVWVVGRIREVEIGEVEIGDRLLPEKQAVQEDAVHLLLDTFCQAHAEGIFPTLSK
jgi:hypothetical protein